MARIIKRNPFEKKVSFTDSELLGIEELANQRQLPKENNPFSEDKRIIERNNVLTHFIGLLGEIAYHKLTNGNIDLDNYLSGDLIKDSELMGISIEIKTLQGYLTFRFLDDFKADVAILIIYDKNNYHDVFVQGWITRQYFNQNYFIDNFGYGDRPCIQPCDLFPIETLKTYCLITHNMRYLYKRVNGNGK